MASTLSIYPVRIGNKRILTLAEHDGHVNYRPLIKVSKEEGLKLIQEGVATLYGSCTPEEEFAGVTAYEGRLSTRTAEGFAFDFPDNAAIGRQARKFEWRREG